MRSVLHTYARCCTCIVHWVSCFPHLLYIWPVYISPCLSTISFRPPSIPPYLTCEIATARSMSASTKMTSSTCCSAPTTSSSRRRTWRAWTRLVRGRGFDAPDALWWLLGLARRHRLGRALGRDGNVPRRLARAPHLELRMVAGALNDGHLYFSGHSPP